MNLTCRLLAYRCHGRSGALNQLGNFLEEVFRQYHRPELLGSDPLVMVHGFDDPRDREVAALFAALLAYGNVKQINASLGRLFAAMDWRPRDFILAFHWPHAARALAGFKHRFADERDILCLCWLLHQAVTKQSLEDAFRAGILPGETDLAPAAGRFVDYLQSFEFGPEFDRAEMLARSSFKHLLPRADKGSACKRIHLFLRWMVRPDDGIDLGLWQSISPAMLLVPIDTHVMRLSRNLGLCERQTASLQFSREVTAKLRKIDRKDPARFDFSLCRLGILKACPTKSDLTVCRTCALYKICRHRRTLEAAQ